MAKLAGWIDLPVADVPKLEKLGIRVTGNGCEASPGRIEVLVEMNDDVLVGIDNLWGEWVWGLKGK